MLEHTVESSRSCPKETLYFTGLLDTQQPTRCLTCRKNLRKKDRKIVKNHIGVGKSLKSIALEQAISELFIYLLYRGGVQGEGFH